MSGVERKLKYNKSQGERSHKILFLGGATRLSYLSLADDEEGRSSNLCQRTFSLA